MVDEKKKYADRINFVLSAAFYITIGIIFLGLSSYILTTYIVQIGNFTPTIVKLLLLTKIIPYLICLWLVIEFCLYFYLVYLIKSLISLIS